MAERGYNEKCSQEVIDAEWASLPEDMNALLRPYRSDAHGFPVVEFVIAGDLRDIIDIKLICRNGSVERAKKFIASELCAAAESVAYAANKHVAELIARL